MSQFNNAALRVLQRAQTMKQQNDGSVLVEKSTEPVDEQKDPLIAEDKNKITNFSDKYGFPFALNHSEENGNGDVLNNNIKKQNGSGSQNGGKPAKEHDIRDRFRRAGMKARLARRMEKIVEDRMTVKQIFNRYVQNSTLHGFRFIFMKTFVIRRLAWAILTCALTAAFLKELYDSVDLFFEYPFTTTSTIEYVPSLKFPAISLCNMNNFDANRIKNSKLKKVYDMGMIPFDHKWGDPGYDIPGEELISILRNSSQPIKNDLLRHCEWRSRETAKTGVPTLCGAPNFTKFSNLFGQTCYTFNPGEMFGKTELHLNETGLNLALKLELDLKANDTLHGVQEVGLKVVVHDQEESPLQQAGFVVSPGFHTFVEMNVRKTENLKPPYATKCGETPLKYWKRDYRQSQCFLEQLSEKVKNNCHCRSGFMLDKSLPYCSLNQTLTCLIPIVHQFDRKTNSECPVDCETIQYITSLSYARFLSSPPIGMELLRDETYIKKLQTTMHTEEFQKYIEENIVVVQFFYQEMKEEIVQQEPSYDFYKLVGDVGGQLGLMLGASVLTLVEFVDLFLFTMYHQLLRLSRRRKREHETDVM